MFLKRLIKFIPSNEYSHALDLYNDGHHEKALRMFEALLARRDRHENLDVATIELFACESLVALSREEMNAGNLEGAILRMEKAIGLKPNFADLRYNLAGLYLEAKRYGEARKNFEAALGINPKYFKAAVSLSRVRFLQGGKEGAIEALGLAEPNCPGFYRESLAELMRALRVGSDDNAVGPLFHEILEERPSSAQISKEVAIEAIQNGNYSTAIRELKKAIALKPDYPDLHNYLGIAYGNSGMSDDAIEEFETALKINPYYLKARLNLALGLYECGRYLEANNHIERVLSVQPDNQLARNLLNELKAVNGRK